MDITIIIDIVNFILMILLMDFFNGIHNNYLARKLKSGAMVIVIFIISSLALCFLTHFFLPAKLALLVIELLLILSVFITKAKIKKQMRYTDVEAGKEKFFGNHKVMIFVPHEDDDINLAGGVIEEYIKHRSTVYIVFSTNGDGDERFDMSRMGAIRINEAIRALAVLGVPESNIIFLGYGDGWKKNELHIYNAPHDEVMTSMAGKQATYAIESHPAYHDNNSYTYNHYYDDIKNVILEHLPDTIFCIDYDTHNDHRALSMLFEKVMGEVLKTTDYKPAVYKGYGYRTAWGSAPDFNESVNIASSVSVPADGDVKLYNWNKRIRLPIDINSVSRYLKRSNLYTALLLYASQHAAESADRIINGDKVFWKRRTDSILNKARISVSSGNREKLTDFMLLDCDDLIHHGDKPYDGIWHPDEEDHSKEINISFDTMQYIDNIVLYDSPSPEDNILNAKVILDDNTEISTGKLASSGTSISVKKKVISFKVRIDEFKGSCFGLSEIEAFSTSDSNNAIFYKITDDKGNFIYDYIIPPVGKQTFGIYSNIADDDRPTLYVHCDNKKCKTTINTEGITVICPQGQKCILTVLDNNANVLDKVLIRNPSNHERCFLMHWIDQLDKTTLKKTYVHKMYRKLRRR